MATAAASAEIARATTFCEGRLTAMENPVESVEFLCEFAVLVAARAEVSAEVSAASSAASSENCRETCSAREYQ